MRRSDISLMLLSLAGGAAVGLGLAATPAPAQLFKGHNSNAPINFNAGSIEIQDRADRVVLAGGVAVQQANLTIRSARMTIAYTGTNGVDVNRITATGGVTITRGNERAVGSTGIYDLDQRLITLVGNVQVTEGSNRLNGGRVVIDLGSGRATITGGGGSIAGAPAQASGNSGRVTGTFTVPQRR